MDGQGAGPVGPRGRPRYRTDPGLQLDHICRPYEKRPRAPSSEGDSDDSWRDDRYREYPSGEYTRPAADRSRQDARPPPAENARGRWSDSLRALPDVTPAVRDAARVLTQRVAMVGIDHNGLTHLPGRPPAGRGDPPPREIAVFRAAHDLAHELVEARRAALRGPDRRNGERVSPPPPSRRGLDGRACAYCDAPPLPPPPLRRPTRGVQGAHPPTSNPATGAFRGSSRARAEPQGPEPPALQSHAGVPWYQVMSNLRHAARDYYALIQAVGSRPTPALAAVVEAAKTRRRLALHRAKKLADEEPNPALRRQRYAHALRRFTDRPGWDGNPT